jgi:hypothetical protein
VRWLASLLLLTGCPWGVPTPVAKVQHGPAFAAPRGLLAALPVACSKITSLDSDDLCAPGQLAAVASATRMALEFAGESVIDSERINAELRLRTTHTEEDLARRAPAGPDTFAPPETGVHEETTMTGGLTWAELSPPAQEALLATLGADGLIGAELSFGPPRGLSWQRTVGVRVSVRRLDGALAWRAGCEVETGDYHTVAQAIDLATRCALESAALW